MEIVQGSSVGVQSGDDFASTPHTNRGVGEVKSVHSTVFSFDWFRVTVWASYASLAPLLDLLGVRDQMVMVSHGALGFNTVFAGLNGFQVACDPVTEAGHDPQQYCSVMMPGKALAALGADKLPLIYQWLCESGFRWQPSRLDLAFDTQSFAVADFVDAFEGKQVLSAAKRYSEIKGSDGHTFYLGSRSSTAMLRVYHKTDGHSFADEPFTRVELELKAERAQAAFRALMAAPMSEWAALAAAWLNGFVQVTTHWWEAFRLTLEVAWLSIKQPVNSVARIQSWLHKQVAPSLATWVAAVAGGDLDVMTDLIRGLLLDGQSRFKKRNEALIAAYSDDVTPSFAVFSF